MYIRDLFGIKELENTNRIVNLSSIDINLEFDIST